MKNVSLFLIVFFVLNMFMLGQSEVQYNMDSVVVTASRLPVSFSEIGRSIEIISQKEIELLPATTIQDLLEYNSGLDVKQRGPSSVQADVSIRGGSFEQTLILIDGIKLTDPQTGHHNMNLPISFSQVERVEILKGQGSRIFGANAFGGVVNIITKKNAINNLNIDISGGENSYFNLGMNGSIKLGNTNHHISLSRTKSDGYRFNTNFENYKFSINNSFNFSNSIIKSIFGYTDKDFGANSFYTTRFPNQAEKTKTFLAAVSADIGLKELNIIPKIYWRKNEDEFLLDKSNPSFYKNNHETNVYGGEIQASTYILGGATSFGIEYRLDKIISNNLGEHNRERKGFFLEQQVSLTNNLNLSLGGYAYYYSNIHWKFWPGVDIAYTPITNMKLYANFGRAFRIPTYTELYYNDPVTLGNSSLNPEESTNYEFGLNYNFGIIRFNTSYFRKKGTNLIDYVLDNSDDLWKAQNISKINTDGLEIGLLFRLNEIADLFINQIKIDYTYLDSDKLNISADSRYVLDHLRHDLTIKLFHDLPYDILQSWAINYEDRIILDDHFTLDTKLSKNFNNFSLFIKASNLLNKSYEEIPGVPLPGRWIISGIRFNIL